MKFKIGDRVKLKDNIIKLNFVTKDPVTFYDKAVGIITDIQKSKQGSKIKYRIKWNIDDTAEEAWFEDSLEPVKYPYNFEELLSTHEFEDMDYATV